MQSLYHISSLLVDKVSTAYVRYLYAQIDWNDRLIGIRGSRGVGKTTMLLQFLKLHQLNTQKALYVSLDNIWFSQHSLWELAESHYNYGGEYLVLDEVHRYKNWSLEIKNIYDSFPGMHIIFTGSSLLEIDQSIADLSRRCIIYDMKGLSFREYLNFEGEIFDATYSLTDIVENHLSIAASIVSQTKVLPKFKQYLQYGYYPYYKTNKTNFLLRVQQTVNAIIDYDIPAVADIEYDSLLKTKRLLVILSELVPYTLNIQALCSSMEITRNQLLKLIDLLSRANVITLLHSKDCGMKQLVKPEKILFNNTNIMFALSEKVDDGTVRESFVSNQLLPFHRLTMPQQGDILVDERLLFEIGGKAKTFKQIKDIPNSYVLADDIETGLGNKIPIWLLGFLY